MIIELVKLGSMVITLNKSAACASRIQGILEVKKFHDQSRCLRTPSTGERGTGRGFPSCFLWLCRSAEAVTDLDFAIPKGSTVGIIGGTGSGKTTLVNLIPRFMM